VGHVDLAGIWHEASFRLLEVYDVRLGADWRIALDRQPYGEVVEVMSGACRFELGAHEVVLGPGELGILLPGPARVTAAIGPEPLHVRGFGFRIEHLGAIELSGLLRLPLSVPAATLVVRSLIGSVVEYGQVGSPAAALRARGHAELVTANLVEAFGQVPSRLLGERRPEIQAAVNLMEADLSAPLDVATLARIAHLSPKHFARCFRDVVGVPPMAYLQAVRLSRARLMLATTQRTISTIAMAHGFADAPHFTRSFKRQYGVTPSQFRFRQHERGLADQTPSSQATVRGSQPSSRTSLTVTMGEHQTRRPS
jgi:AraC-like DNA-binding protein